MDDIVFTCFDAVPPGEVLHVARVGRSRGRLCLRLTGTDRAIRWAEAVIHSGTAVITIDGRKFVAKFYGGSDNSGFIGDVVRSEMLVDLLAQDDKPESR